MRSTLFPGHPFWLLALMPLSAWSAGAATFVVTPEADARILNIPGAYQTANYARDILSVYTATANEQRTLMRFDLSGINLPAGERVASALLTLVASVGFGGSQERPTEIYRVIRPWSETGLTWLQRDEGIPWLQPGGEYVGRTGSPDLNPYAVSTNNPTEGASVTWEIAGLVDEWIEGVSPNHGLLLRSYVGNGLTFRPKEDAVPARRPVLTITTAPGTPRLRVDSSSAGQITLSWRGLNAAVLVESASAASTDWPANGASANFSNGRTQVTISPSSKTRFFRLRFP